MFEYLLLDAGFAVVGGLASCLLSIHRPKRLAVVIGALVVLTVGFDSLLITLGFFSYNPQHLIGWYVWRAPLEDFAYPLMAAVLLPTLYERLRK